MEATEGKMFKPLAYTVMLALGGSIAFALVAAPVLASWLLDEKPYRESRLFAGLKRGYRRLLVSVLEAKAPVFLLLAGLVAGAALVLGRIGTEFIPVLDEGAISIDIGMAPSIALEEAERTVQRLNRNNFV